MPKIITNAFIILFCTGFSLLLSSTLFRQPPTIEFLIGALLVPLIFIQAEAAIAWRRSRLG